MPRNVPVARSEITEAPPEKGWELRNSLVCFFFLHGDDRGLLTNNNTHTVQTNMLSQGISSSASVDHNSTRVNMCALYSDPTSP